MANKNAQRQKTITLIVPIYNGEEFLDECLSSLARQKDERGISIDDYLVIMIDDGSTDSSPIIAMKYAEQYPDRFVYMKQENSGIAAARNRGIDLCDTEYLMFVDNDDTVDSDFVLRHLRAIESSGLDIVVSGYKRGRDGKVFGEVKTTEGPWNKYRFMAPWAKIYKTNFLKDNQIRFFANNIGEDVVFLIRAYERTSRIGRISYAGYIWRVNDLSVSNSIQRGLQPECHIDCVVRELNNAVIEGEEDLLNYFRFRYCVWYLLFSGRSATADRFVEVANRLIGSESGFSLTGLLSPLSKRLKGEPVRNRFSVLLFEFLSRRKGFRSFARHYCNPKL